MLELESVSVQEVKVSSRKETKGKSGSRGEVAVKKRQESGKKTRKRILKKRKKREGKSR